MAIWGRSVGYLLVVVVAVTCTCVHLSPHGRLTPGGQEPHPYLCSRECTFPVQPLDGISALADALIAALGVRDPKAQYLAKPYSGF